MDRKDRTPVTSNAEPSADTTEGSSEDNAEDYSEDYSEDFIDGVVLGALTNDRYSVEVRGGRKIVAHVTGKMRMNFTRILPGDRVTVEPSPYDRTRGRIVAKA